MGPKSKSKLPRVPKATIEVDTSWLLEEAKTAADPIGDLASKSRKTPPRLPGAPTNGPPPMPVPNQTLRPSRPSLKVTMEVRAEWLEEALKVSMFPAPEAKAKAAASAPPPPSKRRGRASAPPTPAPAVSIRPKRRTGPPIPRED